MNPSPHHPRQILLTGGAGFIGSHLVRHLLDSQRDLRIVNLDRLTYAADPSRLAEVEDDPRLRSVEGDICDGELVRSILASERIDTIIHLAAESHVDRSIEGPAEFVRTNLVGTFTLLEAAREAWLDPGSGGSGQGGAEGRSEMGVDRRFLHLSTDEVFGDLASEDPPFLEGDPYVPSSPYAASKAGGDHLVRAYHRTYGLPVVVAHPSNNYGPHQHGEKFIPTVIRACARGEPIPVYGDGGNTRDWLHVSDNCRALTAILREGELGESYLVGARTERTNLQVVRKICAYLDELQPEKAPHEDLISFVRDRPGHDWRYGADPARLEKELGWQPLIPFDRGLRETVEWYLDREGTAAVPD